MVVRFKRRNGMVERPTLGKAANVVGSGSSERQDLGRETHPFTGHAPGDLPRSRSHLLPNSKSAVESSADKFTDDCSIFHDLITFPTHAALGGHPRCKL